jgi:hypothetical protein
MDDHSGGAAMVIGLKANLKIYFVDEEVPVALRTEVKFRGARRLDEYRTLAVPSFAKGRAGRSKVQRDVLPPGNTPPSVTNQCPAKLSPAAVACGR